MTSYQAVRAEFILLCDAILANDRDRIRNHCDAVRGTLLRETMSGCASNLRHIVDCVGYLERIRSSALFESPLNLN